MKPNFKLISGVLALLISFTTGQAINVDSNSIKTEAKHASTANKIKKKPDTTPTGYAGWFASTRVAKFLKLQKFAREYPRVFTFVSFTVITAAVTAAVTYGCVKLFEQYPNIREMTLEEIDNEIKKLKARKIKTNSQRNRLEDLISTRDTCRDIDDKLNEEIPTSRDSILDEIRKLEGLKNKPNINQQTQETIQGKLATLYSAKNEKLTQKENESNGDSLLIPFCSSNSEFDLAYIDYLLHKNTFKNQPLEPCEHASLLASKAILEYRIAFSDEKVSTEEKNKLLDARDKAVKQAVQAFDQTVEKKVNEIDKEKFITIFEVFYNNSDEDFVPPFDQLAIYCKLKCLSPTAFISQKENLTGSCY